MREKGGEHRESEKQKSSWKKEIKVLLSTCNRLMKGCSFALGYKRRS